LSYPGRGWDVPYSRSWASFIRRPLLNGIIFELDINIVTIFVTSVHAIDQPIFFIGWNII